MSTRNYEKVQFELFRLNFILLYVKISVGQFCSKNMPFSNGKYMRNMGTTFSFIDILIRSGGMHNSFVQRVNAVSQNWTKLGQSFLCLLKMLIKLESACKKVFFFS